VEGKKTEPQIYPKWLKHLAPHLSQVNFSDEANVNNYYIISGKGSPRILTVELANSVIEINALGHYDWLILVIDADDMTVQEKIAEVEQFITTENIALNSSCHLQIVTQKCCMETWFLGNNKIFPRNSDNADFINHSQFYDISQQDPELMTKPEWFNNGSISIYHEAYLRKMLAEKHIRYSKSNPNEVGEKHYLEQLQKRVKETNHLPSLKNFLSFCATISAHNPS
jgi:hypothetical protein